MPTTIKTTLGDLSKSEAALKKLLGLQFDKPEGAKLRYRVAKMAKLVAAETQHFYEEYNALINKHGEGEPKKIASDSKEWPAFTAAVEALSAIEVELPMAPMTAAMIDPYPEISGADMLGLGPLFVFDDGD